MHDAHFHMSEELFFSLKRHGMKGIANAQSIEEYYQLKDMQQEYSFSISAGIHPWDASLEAFEQMEGLLKEPEVTIIGEIGMDNVWCETNPEVQREVFEKQIKLAFELQKPVILHTKGREKEIVEVIRQYPNRYLVHWYSCEDYLHDYVELDCYFTIGPSVGFDLAVSKVAKHVSVDRLLIETDGIDAIRWVQDAYPLLLEERELHADSLERTIREIAKIKGMTHREVEKQLEENLERFLA